MIESQKQVLKFESEKGLLNYNKVLGIQLF